MSRTASLAIIGIALVLTGTSPVEVRQAAPPIAAAGTVNAAPFYAGMSDPASLTRVIEGHLATVRQSVDRVLSVTGTRTPENTLRPYDDALGTLNVAGGLSYVVQELHPDQAMRAAAEGLFQKIDAIETELSLNRRVFDALVAIDAGRASPDVRHYLTQEIAEYRRSGVDKDAATREKVTALRDQLVETTTEFSRRIREGVRRIQVESEADLAGLPADFIAAHRPDASGRITLTTEATDLQPVMSYAKSTDLRKRLFVASQNVAYPENLDVLSRMVSVRSQIARTLGYATWADYDIEDRMAATSRAASDFIDRVVAASARKSADDYRLLLERKRRDDPTAASVNAWETAYYTEQLRQSDYRFDSQAVRPYFPYDRVREGVFAVTGRLFGLQFTRTDNVPTWHPSVEVFDVSESGRAVGRIYLDMHPRAGKAGSGASTGTIRNGVAGRQLPEIVLICRFPGGQPGDPGLMTHAQVVTFFHEFGHLVHAISSGRQQWVRNTRVRERDFVEAPSQMLEEWVNDPVPLATFGRHYQTNEPIPADLVRQMRRASELGRGLTVRSQMVLARLSLSLHDRDPAAVDVMGLYREFMRRYSPIPVVEESHMPAAFSHLANGNYSAGYYTYMWSLVIAKDLFSGFNRADLLDPVRARAYREAILVPGGSKPAAELVRTFLGRPFSATAWEAWLNEETR